MPQGGLEKNRPNKTPGVSIWQQRVVCVVRIAAMICCNKIPSSAQLTAWGMELKRLHRHRCVPFLADVSEFISIFSNQMASIEGRFDT